MSQRERKPTESPKGPEKEGRPARRASAEEMARVTEKLLAIAEERDPRLGAIGRAWVEAVG